MGVYFETSRSVWFILTVPDLENRGNYQNRLTVEPLENSVTSVVLLLYPQGVQGPGQAPGGAARRSRRLLGTGWADPRSRTPNTVR